MENLPDDWLKDWAKLAEKIKRELWKRTQSMAWGWLAPSQLPDNFQGRDFEERKDYVEVRLRSMRIPYKSVGVKKFYGAVHSFISIDTLTSGRAVFNVVTTPAQLQNVDPTGLDNVIQSDLLLLGPIPYQGGDINIEAGVFSVLSDDLIAPFLKVIEDVSKTAGVSIVSQAIPFVVPIENAIYHLIGYDKDNKLEIGLSTALMAQPIKEGFLVVVGSSPDDGFLSKLKLHKDGRLFEGDREINDKPYMVLTIMARRHRNGYVLPDVKKAMANLMTAIGQGNRDTILQFFGDFKNVVNSSPDLLPDDARTLIQQTYEERVKPVLESLTQVSENCLKEAEKFLRAFGDRINQTGIDP